MICVTHDNQQNIFYVKIIALHWQSVFQYWLQEAIIKKNEIIYFNQWNQVLNMEQISGTYIVPFIGNETAI